MNEATGRLTDGQVSPALDEIRRLRKSWMDLGQRAEELEAQRGEDMQRSGEYQEIVVAVEELFHQVSREWDYLARYQAFLWRHTVCSFLIGCIYLLTLNTCIIYCIHTLSCVTIITLSQQKQLLFVSITLL